jgi:hypothetical protein
MVMKKYSLYILFFLLLTGMDSCKKFESFQTDPNRTTAASPDLLLPTIEQNAFREITTSPALASRQLVYTLSASNDQYYGWTRGSFNDYNSLRQVVRMELEANRVNKQAYIAIAKFFRAYFAMRLTLAFGDIPYTEALKGDEGQYTGKYDRQQDLFPALLNELNEANNILSTSTELVQGDIIYNGNLLKWRKVINSFTLRVLINLSTKANNATLNVKQRFAEIINNPTKYPLFTGNADNAQLPFYDLAGNRYPYYNSNDLQTDYYLEQSFAELLKTYKDPRLFKFAVKAPKFSALGDKDFSAYAGAPGSALITEVTTKVVAGEVSKIHARYYNNPVNEPSVAMSYWELQFIIAEAIVRGWITGNANDYYMKGIQASMEFYGIDATSITDYKNLPEVQLKAGEEIKAIITQKYIASFMNSGWLPFYEQRRTGFPVLDVSGSGVLNNKQVPKRWMYPEPELRLNEASVSEAITRQFQQSDDINGVMWLLKNE